MCDWCCLGKEIQNKILIAAKKSDMSILEEPLFDINKYEKHFVDIINKEQDDSNKKYFCCFLIIFKNKYRENLLSRNERVFGLIDKSYFL